MEAKYCSPSFIRGDSFRDPQWTPECTDSPGTLQVLFFPGRMGRQHIRHKHTGQRNDSRPGWDGRRFHHASQNGMRRKTYELFLEFSIQYFHPGIDCGTEITESETTDKGGRPLIHLQPLRQPLGREVGPYTRHLGPKLQALTHQRCPVSLSSKTFIVSGQ